LSFVTGITCESQTGAIILIRDLLAIDNTDPEHVKTGRIDNQYSATPEPIRDNVVMLIHTAESFNAELSDVIDRLNPV
jgi:hypothetical protein